MVHQGYIDGLLVPHRHALLTGALLFLLQAGVVDADQSSRAATVNDRPRIGLVLSGGGARGLAHIGVLKVLEQNRIPIDMIAGTSAGSIIAGLYAMGMSADEIEKTILGIDWNEGFSDASTRQYRSFQRKQDDLDVLTTLKAGVRTDGVHVPKGLLQGQRLELLLRRITAGTDLVHDFDRLPLPYRAVATNIETGESLVIGRGDIVRAMHASMALPGIYAPVEIDGKLLLDGGLSANLPVKVVRDMGADIIIAVNIGTPLRSAEQLSSILPVIGQVTSLLTNASLDQQLAYLNDNDTLITAELEGFSAASFDKTPSIIAIGEQAARNKLDRLRRYRIDTDLYQAYRTRKQRLSPFSPMIDEIVISSNSRLSHGRLAKHLRIKPGDRFDRAQLEEDIAYLYGLGYFSAITYQLHQEGDQTNLLIDVRRKEWGPNYLRAGLALSGNLSGDNTITLGVGLLATEVNSLGAEWKTDLNIGDRSGIDSEFFQPMSATSDYFVAARITAQKRNINIYQDGQALVAARLTERQVALDFGRQFGNTAEIRLGVSRSSGSAEIITGPSLPVINSQDGAYRLTLKRDTLDNTHFPHQGSYGQLSFSSSKTTLGADADIDLGGFSIYKAGNWGSHSLLGHVSYSDTINNQSALHSLFQLGGFLNLSGYEQDEIGGAYSALATLTYYRTLNHYFIKSIEIPMYIGASIETGNVWLQRNQISLDSLTQAGSLFIGADTYLGPLYIAYGFNTQGRQSTYLFVGRIF